MSQVETNLKEADRLAKELLGIKPHVDMSDPDEEYYNPHYKAYTSFVAGYMKGCEIRQAHEEAIRDSPGAGTQDDINWD